MTATAKVVRAYGVREVGGYGVRGFRSHCEHCGYLSNCVDNYKRAARWSHKHRCERLPAPRFSSAGMDTGAGR